MRKSGYKMIIAKETGKRRRLYCECDGIPWKTGLWNIDPKKKGDFYATGPVCPRCKFSYWIYPFGR